MRRPASATCCARRSDTVFPTLCVSSRGHSERSVKLSRQRTQVSLATASSGAAVTAATPVVCCCRPVCHWRCRHRCRRRPRLRVLLSTACGGRTRHRANSLRANCSPRVRLVATAWCKACEEIEIPFRKVRAARWTELGRSERSVRLQCASELREPRQC